MTSSSSSSSSSSSRRAGSSSSSRRAQGCPSASWCCSQVRAMEVYGLLQSRSLGLFAGLGWGHVILPVSGRGQRGE
jgi:hypothetical protein